MVGTDGYGSQAHGYPKTNRNAGSRLAQPRFGREESIKDAWHARDRCLSRSRTAMWMRPAAQPHDVPSLSWGHHAFSTLIMRAYRHPEFRTNRQCIASSLLFSSLLLPSPAFVMFAPHKFFPSWSWATTWPPGAQTR